MSGGVNSDSSIVSRAAASLGVSVVVDGESDDDDDDDDDDNDNSLLPPFLLCSLPLLSLLLLLLLEADSGGEGDWDFPADDFVLSSVEGLVLFFVVVVVVVGADGFVVCPFFCCSVLRPCFRIRNSSSRAASQALASEITSLSSRLGIPSVSLWRDDASKRRVASDDAMAISFSNVRVEDNDVGGSVVAVFFFFLMLLLLSSCSMLVLWVISPVAVAAASSSSSLSVVLAGLPDGGSLRGRFFDTPLLSIVGVAARLPSPMVDK